jgi:hypothetical protein
MNVYYANSVGVGAVIVVNYKALKLLEVHTAVCEVKIPTF